MAGVAQVLGVVRVAAIGSDVVLFDPQPRVVANRLVIVCPAVRPVAIDAKTLFFSAVGGKTRAVLAAGPQRARGAIEVAAGRLVGERVAFET
jgi:hypothetical protein